ncbi:MAG: hypothetical protein R2795_25365 [Saprospiraceae bacterium]
MQSLNWTGNIRELRNVVERLLILSEQTVTPADVEQYVVPSAASPSASSLHHLFEQFDSLEALQQHIATVYRQAYQLQ